MQIICVSHNYETIPWSFQEKSTYHIYKKSRYFSEAFSETSQTSKMEVFVEIVDDDDDDDDDDELFLWYGWPTKGV